MEVAVNQGRQRPVMPPCRAQAGGGWEAIDTLTVAEAAFCPIGMSTVMELPAELREQWAAALGAALSADLAASATPVE